jgi:hypothetical protein
MGYGVGTGASDGHGEYGNTPEDDAYLAVRRGVRNGDIKGELAKSPWDLVRSEYNTYTVAALTESAERAKRINDTRALETIAAVGLLSKASLGLPENPTNHREK